MIAVNVQGLLHTTHAALPHLLKAAEEGPRQVADIVNISSLAGRAALAPEDIADGVTYMVTRPRHASIGELWITPTDQP